jgi:hypothetical protein
MRDKIHQYRCCLRHQTLLARSRSRRTYIPGSKGGARWFEEANVWPMELGSRFIESRDRTLK